MIYNGFEGKNSKIRGSTGSKRSLHVFAYRCVLLLAPNKLPVLCCRHCWVQLVIVSRMLLLGGSAEHKHALQSPLLTDVPEPFQKGVYRGKTPRYCYLIKNYGKSIFRDLGMICIFLIV